MWKRLLSLTMVLCLLCVSIVPVHGEEPIDLDRTGTITLTIHTQKGTVPGGSLKLFRAADLEKVDGELKLIPTEDFAGYTGSLETDKSKELAASLAKYAEEKKLAWRVMKVDGNGKAEASGLPLGLYLIAQEEPAEGYAPINPFVVLLPMTGENGELLYSVDASPKVETSKKPNNNPPDNPPNNNPPGNPPGGNPPGGKLPKTGQLWWPVPVLACSGLVLFAIGWMRRKNTKDEKK